MKKALLLWTLLVTLVAGPEMVGGGLTWFPGGEVWQPYRADPLEPRNGVSFLAVHDPDIPDAGDQRFHLELGGTFAFLEWTSFGRRWQVAASAGFRGQFDQQHSQDNLGWDGVYGVLLLGELGSRLTLKTGIMHTSSHIGDELIERTGAERIGYTRQEMVSALSWQATGRSRLYGEAGWGFDLRNEELQEPGRAQLGFEATSKSRGSWRWVGALNLGAFEEHDWRIDTTIVTGLEWSRGSRRWRIGIELHDGRVPLGELSFARERWVGFGVLLDP